MGKRFDEVFAGEEGLLDSWPAGGELQADDDDHHEHNGADQTGNRRLNLLMNTILASFELDLTYLVSVRGIVLPGFGWCCGHVMNVARFLNAGMAGCHRKIPAAPGQGVVTL